jgi:hypothetical protein
VEKDAWKIHNTKSNPIYISLKNGLITNRLRINSEQNSFSNIVQHFVYSIIRLNPTHVHGGTARRSESDNQFPGIDSNPDPPPHRWIHASTSPTASPLSSSSRPRRPASRLPRRGDPIHRGLGESHCSPVVPLDLFSLRREHRIPDTPSRDRCSGRLVRLVGVICGGEIGRLWSSPFHYVSLILVPALPAGGCRYSSRSPAVWACPRMAPRWRREPWRSAWVSVLTCGYLSLSVRFVGCPRKSPPSLSLSSISFVCIMCSVVFVVIWSCIGLLNQFRAECFVKRAK